MAFRGPSIAYRVQLEVPFPQRGFLAYRCSAQDTPASGSTLSQEACYFHIQWHKETYLQVKLQFFGVLVLLENGHQRSLVSSTIFNGVQPRLIISTNDHRMLRNRSLGPDCNHLNQDQKVSHRSQQTKIRHP